MKYDLSPKEKRRLAGKKGASKSHWRFGFQMPLSANDVHYQERIKRFREEQKK